MKPWRDSVAKPISGVGTMSEPEETKDRFASLALNPNSKLRTRRFGRLLEEAVERLPDAYRTIFRAAPTWRK